MGWLIAIGAYLLLLVFVCLLVRGGAIRECPQPAQANVELESLQPMQAEAVPTMAFDPETFSEWSGEIDISTATLAQPNL